MDRLRAFELRTVTIDRVTEKRVARELIRQHLASPRGRRYLTGIGAVALLTVLMSHRVLSGVVVGVVLFVLLLALWRSRIDRDLRNGCEVGQTITVGYLEPEVFTVIDDAGEVRLHRGSALGILRRGGVVSILGASSQVLLPSELLTDADAAFLEGYGDGVPRPAGPELPLSLDITAGVQNAVVAAQTRVLVTSADFMFVPVVLIPTVMFFALITRSWTVALVGVVAAVAFEIPQLRLLSTARQGIRSIFPIGITLRAHVTNEHLILTHRFGTFVQPWRSYRAHRFTAQAVLLSRKRGKPALTLVLPRDLFPHEAQVRISKYVPTKF